ncbi:MAG: universal stress protein [Nitriliruptor sp.]|uniref:universal stress protein n=1 Tax=Nitriliruptor sp. TaxID=2448056 RepID=UPI00349FEF82
MGVIVVGVDGSEESRAALGWAANEARLRTAALRAVYVYEHTPAWQMYGYGDMTAPIGIPERSIEDTAVEAARHARQLVERMVAQLDDHDLPVEVVVHEDRRPARALVELANSAELLVVGSRGRGGFSGLLLGSVSQQCVQHAHCPVVVLPPQE